MQYRKLGASELEVSEIALGSWLTFGVGIEARSARDCVRRAFDTGINFIDTANVYGRGAAESFLGEVLTDYDRSSYVLATKLFFPMSDTDYGLSRQQVLKQVDASLARLKVDYVDLYQCHRYDPDTPLQETMDALTEVVRSGKARYVGFSEWEAGQIRGAREIKDVEHFVSSQPQYSMLWRVPEREVMPVCSEQGTRQIVWSPLAQGILTGKYRAGRPPPADSRLSSERMNQFMGRYQEAGLLDAVQSLKPIADTAGLSMPQLALAWVLQHDDVASAIIGATKPDQVTENAKASGVKLGAETMAAVDQALEGFITY